METERIRYIYCITNLVNGKTYFGQRTLTEGRTFETDTYRGSGKLLWKAYEKYGKENFKRECIIEGRFSKEQINRFEKCVIAIQRLCGKAEYNIADGGEGWNEGMREAHWKAVHTEEYFKHLSARMKKAHAKGISYTFKRHDTYGTLGKHWNVLEGSHTGSKNSQFGTHWYTNGEVNVKAKTCPVGFRLGRVLKKDAPSV